MKMTGRMNCTVRQHRRSLKDVSGRMSRFGPTLLDRIAGYLVGILGSIRYWILDDTHSMESSLIGAATLGQLHTYLDQNVDRNVSRKPEDPRDVDARIN